ncbi:neurogenic locus notch homolog protein 1-like isoform X4 [Dreissena polymorpha]|uniref:neurogenic locus notch homolog protein 1-like isoform X4 n=1 Tax=Dreissena polymorpha TaxID=45954 RepID=UPI00226466D6|nr:neurogenic locus notch homolog protein 1-like isoform X4 [Dreissena polymorpha]
MDHTIVQEEEQNIPLNDRTDDTASQGRREQRRENRQFYQRCSLKVTCGVTNGVWLVLCTVLSVVVYKQHCSNQPAAAPSNTSALAAGNSTLTGPDTQEKIEYSINVKRSSCQGVYCRQCNLTINASVKPVKHHEGNDCQRYYSHTGYRDCAANSSFGCIGKCMDCNGTCRNYSSMVQYLGKQSPCTEDIETIKCCTLLHMLPDNYCRNGGNLSCEGDMNKPKCTCPVGWTGDICETRMNETVTCKCFKTEITWNSFCGENDMYNCTDDDRPENWTECRHTIERVTFSRCVCEKSEVHHSTTSLQECDKEEISVLNQEALIQSKITSFTPSLSSNGAAMVSRSAAITLTFPLILIYSILFQANHYI